MCCSQCWVGGGAAEGASSAELEARHLELIDVTQRWDCFLWALDVRDLGCSPAHRAFGDSAQEDEAETEAATPPRRQQVTACHSALVHAGSSTVLSTAPSQTESQEEAGAGRKGEGGTTTCLELPNQKSLD